MRNPNKRNVRKAIFQYWDLIDRLAYQRELIYQLIKDDYIIEMNGNLESFENDNADLRRALASLADQEFVLTWNEEREEEE